MEWMLPSWRLARNNLVGRRGRTVLMVASIALAASLVTAVSCAIRSAQAGFEAGMNSLIGATDARIFHSGQGRIDAALLETVRTWPDVRLATGRLYAPLTLVRADGRRDEETGEPLRMTPHARGIEPELEFQFRPVEFIAGQPPREPDEIMLDPLTAEGLHANVGDVLHVQRFGEPIVLRVCGIYDRQRLGALQRPEVLLPRDTLAEASDRQDSLTFVAIILKEGTDVSGFCERHIGELPQHLVLEPAERAKSGFDRRVLVSRLGLIIGSMLTFLGASFIVVTGMTTAVTERQREMAVQRCIGASRGQLFAAQLWTGGILGALGGVIGVPLGMALAAFLLWIFAELVPTGLSPSMLGTALALSGAIFAGLGGALYPAWLASRVPPLQAMSMQARPVRSRSIAIACVVALALIAMQVLLATTDDATTAFWRYVLIGLPLLYVGYFTVAVPVLMAVSRVMSPALSVLLRLPGGMVERSIAATPFRHGFTAGALMLGISIMIATWATAGSLMRDFLGRVHFADAFAFRTSGLTAQDQAAIAALPFVTRTCPIGYLPVKIIGQHVFGVRGLAPTNVVCVGFPPETFFEMNRVDWLAGDPADAIAGLKRGDSVIVAEQFLKARSISVGDTIRLGAGRIERDFAIVGVVGAPGLEIAIQFFGIQSAYNEAALSCVFMDMETVRRCFDNPDIHVMQVNLVPGTTDEEAESQVRVVAPTVLFRSGRQIRQTLDDIANALLTVNTTVAFSALLLASLSVGNVIAANIHSRRFEYGVLRAVGGGRGVVIRLILAEAAIIALTAAIVGTALGMHLAWMETRHYRALAGIELHLLFPAGAAAIGWIVLLAMALLAAAPTAISLARKRPTALLSAGRNG